MLPKFENLEFSRVPLLKSFVNIYISSVALNDGTEFWV